MATREQLTLNSHVRIWGEDAPAHKTLLRAAKQETPPFQLIGSAANPASSNASAADFCLIDSTLQIDYARPAKEPPHAGVGYAGFTPGQRATYLAWLDDPARPAASAYQQLYLATLEVALFEGKREASQAQRELLRLDASKHWHNHELLDRAILLSFWLAQDGEGLFRWLTNIEVSAHALATAVGQLALLGQSATVDLLLALMRSWQLLNEPTQLTEIGTAVIELRLNSLQDTLGKDVLVYALEQVGERGKEPLPWRCAHRDLRIALAQPNLRPIMEPLLRETTTWVDPAPEKPNPLDPTQEGEESEEGQTGDWNLVLEFQHSRSSYFPFALELAQRQEGYRVLMDENRHMIYRIIFPKHKLRPFWRIWDWVQPWSGTRVYVNGKELEKWQVWPYSQYMR